jgi:hypothetical protein
MGDKRSTKKLVSALATLALIGALVVPLVAITTTGAGAGAQLNECEVSPGSGGGGGCEDPCGNDFESDSGVTQGGSSQGCCPDGSPGGFQWGGYAGQNRYWCEAPPYEPPATAEPTPTEEPAVSPTTAAAKKAAAPKQAAAAKPAFTG